MYPSADEIAQIEADHLDGLHFGNVEGLCPICEIDDNDPEAPDTI